MNTGFGGIGAVERGYGYGSGGRSRNHKDSSTKFPMATMQSANKDIPAREVDDEQDGHLPYDSSIDNLGAYVGSDTAPMMWINGSEAVNGETTSIGSDGSGQMIIRKETEWEVRTVAGP